MTLHFAVGNTLKGQVSAMDCREVTLTILSIAKKRPLTFLVEEKIDPKRSAFESSMFGSGITKQTKRITDASLRERIENGWQTSRFDIQTSQKKSKSQKPHSTHPHIDEDEEYWNYIHDFGSNEEKRVAAEYFDVSPNAFDESYESAIN